jgi:acyl-CoA synthetase (NDP forming)
MFEDYLKTFAFLRDRPASGNRVAILSNAGFECTVSADRLFDLKLAEFSEETEARMAEHLPGPIVKVRNPLDTTPTTKTEDFLALVGLAVEDDGVDAVIVSPLPITPFLNTLPKGEGHTEDILREDSVPQGLLRIAASTKKPLLVCVDAGRLYDPMADMMELAGIPVFRRIDRATRALSTFVAGV